MAEQSLIVLGIVVVFIGIVILIIGSLIGQKASVKVGFGGFIGPVPFGFANDRPLLYIILALTAALFIISLIVQYRLVG